MKKFTGFFLAMTLGMTASFACGPKANDDQCNKFHDHMLELGVEAGMKEAGDNLTDEQKKAIKEMAKKELDKDKDQFMKDCKASSAAEVECATKAKSIEDIDKC